MSFSSKLLAAAAFCVTMTCGAAAQAEVLSFDDADVSIYQPISNDYHGYTFNSFAFIGPEFGPSGYRNDVVSGSNVACGCQSDYGLPYSSISNAKAFDLNSGYFASAWNNNALLTIVGLTNGLVSYTSTTLLGTASPTFINLGFGGITEARFSIAGGTNAGYSGAGDYFAVDNLSLNATSAVPEPASWAMMILGVGAVGFATRRRQATKTTVSYA